MRMKNLLEHHFISHYGLTACVAVDVVSTTDAEFDLKDDAVLVYPFGAGLAKYSNPNHKEVNVINYEHFINTLPTIFQQGRKKCDLIVYTSDLSHFILNELTKTGKNKSRKRMHAVEQMQQVLRDISDVVEIKLFIDQYSIKKCCYFNKKSQSPSIRISAPTSFSKLSYIAPHGFKMSNLNIESLGFELWEFSGNQTYLLG